MAFLLVKRQVGVGGACRRVSALLYQAAVQRRRHRKVTSQLIRWQGNPYRRAARPEERKPRGRLIFRFTGAAITRASFRINSTSITNVEFPEWVHPPQPQASSINLQALRSKNSRQQCLRRGPIYLGKERFVAEFSFQPSRK
ncbi:hypothetical protein [Nonomuraea insulae]|uniref:Uncharacterized protein n=1 Tax=Nonomuraea insulae TaxID=1616787 RepID=A0ABW1CDP1_9ACTN